VGTEGVLVDGSRTRFRRLEHLNHFGNQTNMERRNSRQNESTKHAILFK